MKYADTVILVYAKAPVPGRVNTRLIPDIGVKAATRLHRELLEHRLRQLTQAGLCDTVLMCAPDTRHDFFRYCQRHYRLPLHAQDGRDLGERMSNGVTWALQTYRHCLIVGTDAPALDVARIHEAVMALRTDDRPVFVPAEDGGYVLVGMSRLYAGLFENIDWGTDAVMRQSREQLCSQGIRARELAVSWDIDGIQDYERYCRMRLGNRSGRDAGQKP